MTKRTSITACRARLPTGLAPNLANPGLQSATPVQRSGVYVTTTAKQTATWASIMTPKRISVFGVLTAPTSTGKERGAVKCGPVHQGRYQVQAVTTGSSPLCV